MPTWGAEVITLIVIGLLIIALRSYARITSVGVCSLQADDYLMVLAAVAYVAESMMARQVTSYWPTTNRTNLWTTMVEDSIEKATDANDAARNSAKFEIVGWFMYTFLLWALKSAVCTYYLRLTDRLNLRTRVYVGFGLIVSTYLAVLLAILLGCRPFDRNWQNYPDPGGQCHPGASEINLFVTVTLNILTDMYLLTIPIPMLWKVQLPPCTKAGVMLLLSGGVFVMIAGILRCALVEMDTNSGPQEAAVWGVRETFIAILTANLPMIVPLLRRWTSALGLGQRSGSSPTRSPYHPHGSRRTRSEPTLTLPKRGLGVGVRPRSSNGSPSLPRFTNDRRVNSTPAQYHESGGSTRRTASFSREFLA